jgi:16S rRNA (guanine966-N2)-methyltransferase
LPVADVEGLRPTSERIRETLFNWLGPRIEGLDCLDLYAGTGALGYEALSRGAASVVFVERSAKAMAGLRTSSRALEASGARFEQTDATEYLRRAGRHSFDLVFLDPPFAEDSLADLCRLIAECEVLRPGGRVYLEQARDRVPPVLPDGWSVVREKNAGNVRYSLVTT